MPAVSIPIEELRLDLKNPRIAEAASQRDALQKIIVDQDTKLVVLAESIVEDGVNPMDRFLVIRSEDEPDKFVTLEGNRRLAALKVLRNPSVLTGMEVRASIQRRLEELSTEFDKAGLQTLDCFVIESREDGAMWINQRHTGENDGRGIVDWSGIARRRFRGNDPALQALDFVTERGDLSPDVKQKIEARFPITTLDRLLSTPAVRSAIGFEIRGNKLFTGLPFHEALKPLQRMVRDLVSGVVNVTQLKLQPQMVAYVSSLGMDLPDLSTAMPALVPIEDLFPSPAGSSGNGSTGGSTSAGGSGGSTGGRSSGGSARATSGAGGARSRRTPGRGTALIPKSCVLSVANTKVAEVVKELRSLKLATYPHAISVLFRVFLELSVDEYLKRQGLSITFTAPSGKIMDKKLRKKVDEAVQHMVANGAPAKELKGISNALADKNNPLHPDTLHAYIHNAFYSPTERDLTVAWDNAQPFFERLWP